MNLDYKSLSAEEEAALIEASQDGCQEIRSVAIASLVSYHQRQIARMSSQWMALVKAEGLRVDRDDLLSAGNVALLTCIKRFDPSYIGKARLFSYAYHSCRKAMRKVVVAERRERELMTVAATVKRLAS